MFSSESSRMVQNPRYLKKQNKTKTPTRLGCWALSVLWTVGTKYTSHKYHGYIIFSTILKYWYGLEMPEYTWFFTAYHFVGKRNYLQQITKFSQLVKIMPCIKIKGLEASVLLENQPVTSSLSLRKPTQYTFWKLSQCVLTQ